MLAGKLPRPCAELRRGQVVSVVDEEVNGVDDLRGMDDLHVVILLEGAALELVLADIRHGADKPRYDLAGRHLEGEHQGRGALLPVLLVEDDVLHDVHAEGGLSHRRPRRYDDELAPVEALGHAVKIDKAGGDAGNVAQAVVRKVLRPLLHGGQDLVYDILCKDRTAASGIGALHDIEEELLRGADDGLDVFCALGVGKLRHLGAHIDELPRDRLVADDAGVGDCPR